MIILKGRFELAPHNVEQSIISTSLGEFRLGEGAEAVKTNLAIDRQATLSKIINTLGASSSEWVNHEKIAAALIALFERQASNADFIFNLKLLRQVLGEERGVQRYIDALKTRGLIEGVRTIPSKRVDAYRLTNEALQLKVFAEP
jgi:hypothetical protein